MAEPIVLRVIVEGGEEAAIKLDRVDESMGRVNRRAEESSHSFGLFHRGLAGLGSLAAITGLGGLAFGFADAIKKAEKFQALQAQLGVTLRNAGLNVKGATKQLTDYAAAMAMKGGYSSPEQLRSLTAFVTLTGSATKAMTLNTATMNLARGAHLDYAQAQKFVAMAELGTPGRLQKIIGHIQAVTTATAGWTSAMKKADPAGYDHAKMMDKQATATEIVSRIQARFHGSMAAYSKTSAGAMSNLGNAVDDIAIRLGTLFLPAIASAAHGLLSFIDGFQKGTGIGGAFKSVLMGIWGVVKPFGKAIGSVFSSIGDAISGIGGGKGGKGSPLSSFLSSAKTDALSLYSAFKPVAAGIGDAIKSIGQTASTVFNGQFVQAVMTILKALMGLAAFVGGVLLKTFAFALPGIVNIFKGAFNIVAGVVRFIADLLTLKFGKALGDLRQVFSGAVQFIIGVFQTLTAPIRLVISAIVSAFSGIGGTIKGIFSGVVNIIIDALNWVIGKINGVINGFNSVAGSIPILGGSLTVGTIGKIGSYGGGGGKGPPKATGGPHGSSGLGHRALGGYIFGQGKKDDVPFLGKPGEYVATDKMVSDVGRPAMDAWRAGGNPPGHSSDALVEALSAALSGTAVVMDGKQVGIVMARQGTMQRSLR